jgi:hypothetical protein
LGDQIEKNEIVGACNPHGGEKRCIQAFDGENLRDRHDLEGPGVDGSITLKRFSRSGRGHRMD